jgi:hypothetical protein
VGGRGAVDPGLLVVDYRQAAILNEEGGHGASFSGKQ